MISFIRFKTFNQLPLVAPDSYRDEGEVGQLGSTSILNLLLTKNIEIIA